MSRVTDVILTCSVMEELDETERFPAVDHLNAWMVQHYRSTFVRVDPYAGGTKVMQATVFLCAVNYLFEPEFVRAVQAAPWELAEGVRVFVNREESEGFEPLPITPAA